MEEIRADSDKKGVERHANTRPTLHKVKVLTYVFRYINGRERLLITKTTQCGVHRGL